MQNAEMEFWRQNVKKENQAKRNFEKLTGNYSSAKLYQGQFPELH